MGKIRNNKVIRKYGKSLQFRIFIIFILVGLIPIWVMKYGILNSYESQAVRQRGEMVHSQCAAIAEQVGKSGYLTGTASETVEVEIKQLADLYNGRIVLVNQDFRIVRDTYGLDEQKMIVSEDVLKCFKGEETYETVKQDSYIEMTAAVYDPEGENILGVMMVSVPTTDIQNSREKMAGKVMILQIILALLILAVAFWASKILIKPFGKVTQSLDELTGGFLEDDISIPDYTETQLLSEAYNRMRGRMKALDDSRQEFVSNVSHELKTPITSMKVLADSLLAQEDVPAELYKEFMTDIAEEIDRENKIINDLLSLVKMDKKSSDVNIQETNINDLLDRIIKRLTPIASKAGIDLVLENFKPVTAQVDETKLTLAISNLVENAIKYNTENGWVHVSVNADHKYFYVKVEDSGIGIPEEAQEHIFERFYRVDKSHSREIGGTGLGLAITRSAVLMHRGAIKVYSKEGEGTTFTVRIPLQYVE